MFGCPGDVGKSIPLHSCIVLAVEEPGPGQQYALQARKHIATLRKARPGIIVEIRWCPAHKGVAGNEKADEWAKIAAEEPDARGVEWLSSWTGQRHARCLTQDLSQALGGVFPGGCGWRRAVGWGPGLMGEVRGAEKPGAGRHGCREHQ